MSLVLQAPPVAQLVMTLILVCVQIRRVHDFGRSAWWAVAATLLPLASLALWPVATEETVLLVGMLLVLAMIAVVGFVRGDPGENRFGPPPPFTWKRTLTGR